MDWRATPSGASASGSGVTGTFNSKRHGVVPINQSFKPPASGSLLYICPGCQALEEEALASPAAASSGQQGSGGLPQGHGAVGRVG